MAFKPGQRATVKRGAPKGRKVAPPSRSNARARPAPPKRVRERPKIEIARHVLTPEAHAVYSGVKDAAKHFAGAVRGRRRKGK